MTKKSAGKQPYPTGHSMETPGDAPKIQTSLCPEPPLGRALFRVMRATIFEDEPIPELEVLPLAQLRLLWQVYHSREATMKDFSERLGVSQSTVTQLADRLVKRGLIDRIADQTDRRVVRLRVSGTGKQVLERADALRRQTLFAIWNALTPEEQEAVSQGLVTLANVAEKVRTELGRPLAHWPPPDRETVEGFSDSDSPDPGQPVVDIMNRRVRGRST